MTFEHNNISGVLDKKIDDSPQIKGEDSVADPGECRRGHAPSPSPVQTSHKKMAAKGGDIDFMFLALPPTRPLDPMLEVYFLFSALGDVCRLI